MTPVATAIPSEVLAASTDDLLSEAQRIRDARSHVVTYSPNFFIPLTKLCRDVCHYCAFAVAPIPDSCAYLSVDEVLELARRGVAAGCREALFTLGDKPELRYAAARAELQSLGCTTTLEYLQHAARAVLEQTGLLPHINPGIMTIEDVELLRPVSASMGLMIETTAARLTRRGGPHFGSPDKHPLMRLSSLEAAGMARVPFTTGLLVGIGETRAERVESLLAIRAAHERHGHVQEVIIQNFRAKAGTKMEAWAEPDVDDYLWTIGAARVLLPPEMHLQAPPNLTDDFGLLLDAGIDDWGGVSAVTVDHVNLEAPWPHLDRLAEVTQARGLELAPRLAVYPEWLTEEWLDRRVLTAAFRASDAMGLAREDSWAPGALGRPPFVPGRALPLNTDGELDEDDIVNLFNPRPEHRDRVFAAADALRREVCGDVVSYVVTRNIQYTNVCKFRCGFCAFSKGTSGGLRGRPYLLCLDEIERRTVEAWERGATEVCLQGGIHPAFTGEYYEAVVCAVRGAVPDIHVHAFSALEIWHGATTLRLTPAAFLLRLRQVGLGSLPGTAAEILDDDVRSIICPDKITTAQWLAVHDAAHRLGIASNNTIMFGHVERPRHWARHLIAVREQQRLTGGFTEFVPLPFVPMEAPIYLRGRARRGPTFAEALLMHAVGRITLHPWIRNVQASWVKLGPEGAAAALGVGANDLGGTLMNESISRAAGSRHGQEMSPEHLEALIRANGRVPRQRATLYEDAPADQRARSFAAPPCLPAVERPLAVPSRRAPFSCRSSDGDDE